MRNSGRWVFATSAVLLFALMLAGEGFLMTESASLRPGRHLLSSATALKTLFHPIR